MLRIKSKEHRIKIFNRINYTSSAIVYKAIDEDTDYDLAIKIEKNQNTKSLLNEIKIAKFLGNNSGIVKLIDYGFYENRRFLVFPYYTNSLYKTLLKKKQLFNCAKQIISTLEYIHSKGIVHCDISSKNILCSQNMNNFHLTDFGQSSHFNYTFEDVKSEELVGSPTYCSHHIHKYYEYMPRDDLISLGYLLFYCTTGTLPWCGMKTFREIKEKKLDFMDSHWNTQIPKELKIYFNYAFHLGMNEKPDYQILIKLFSNEERRERRVNKNNNVLTIPI